MTIEDDINEVKARYPHATCRHRAPVIIIHGLDEGIIGEGQTSAEAWAHAARQVARDTQKMTANTGNCPLCGHNLDVIKSALKLARKTLADDMASWIEGHRCNNGQLSAEGKEAVRPFNRAIKKIDVALGAFK